MLKLFSHKEYYTGRWGRKPVFILIRTKNITRGATVFFYVPTVITVTNLQLRLSNKERNEVTVVNV